LKLHIGTMLNSYFMALLYRLPGITLCHCTHVVMCGAEVPKENCQVCEQSL
jgi:hypothetical protein